MVSGWCPDAGGKDISAPAVDLLNENPSHVAFGKKTWVPVGPPGATLGPFQPLLTSLGPPRGTLEGPSAPFGPCRVPLGSL